MTSSPVPGDRRRWVYVFLLLAVTKLAYFLQYAERLPFLEAPLFDSVVYLRQAAAVRSGDFGHPSLLGFSPLYGYLVAATGATGVVVVQFGLGLLNAFLVYRMVRQTWNDTAGLASMVLYGGYGMLMFFETKVMSETLGTTLLLVALTTYHSTSFVKASPRSVFSTGTAFGLATLARANVLLSLPFVVAAAAAPRGADENWRIRFRRSALTAVAIAAVLGANGVWNLGHTGLFVPVVSASRTAADASRSGWQGRLTAFENDQGMVSAWNVVDQAERRIEDPSSYEPPTLDWKGVLHGAPTKAVRTFSDTETTFQYGYYGERQEVPVLQATPVSFGVLLLFSIVGAAAVFRRRDWRAIVPHLPLLLGAVLTSVLFHPSSRYRFPMILPLVHLGGIGVAALYFSKEVVGPMRPNLRRAVVGLVTVVAGLLCVRTLSYELAHPGMWQLRVGGRRGSPRRRRRRTRTSTTSVRGGTGLTGRAPSGPICRLPRQGTER